MTYLLMLENLATLQSIACLVWQYCFFRLANIQKDKNGYLYNRKSDSRAEYSILEELEHKMSVNRKAESKILFGGCCFCFFSSVCLLTFTVVCLIC